ncbi:hypothetical protein [Sedimenticola hydrogenitrophicus]|uniref:hypothetical protein n=1 Tax=Sedimenticola hydrogenitrophicus TaxID=2967975 RepID=UPI0023B1DFDA|nr:hypothetical protein [Sedimenticola hydrogenitrophicus]
MSEFVKEKREQIITALGFPRLLMEQEIKRRVCPEHYRFNDQVEECNECLYILECQCYGEYLAGPALGKASTIELVRLLQFGYEYVTHQLKRQDHETASCSCELCSWIRSVTPLLEAQESVGLTSA